MQLLSYTLTPSFSSDNETPISPLRLFPPCSGLGITGGVHRLRGRTVPSTHIGPFRIFMMLINSVANQGSIYHWARDHRVHHKHVPIQVFNYFSFSQYSAHKKPEIGLRLRYLLVLFVPLALFLSRPAKRR